jgi:hypothetical protein
MQREFTALSEKDGGRHIGCRIATFLLLSWFLIPASGVHSAPNGTFQFDLSSGYRLGGLHWSVAAVGGDPNIASELSWSKLQIFQIEGTGRLTLEGFTIRADVGYGYILAGDVQDSDYDSDDRTDEFSRSYSDAKGGYLFHALTGLGYRFDHRAVPFTLLPMIGIAFHRQGMKMTEGVQVISIPPSTQPLGPFAGLDSSYTANWLNLWVGLDAEYRITKRLGAGAAVAVHPSLYYAEADWNLRTDFQHPVSFVHDGLGWGFSGDLSVGVELSRRFLLEGRFTLEYWSGGPGIAETYWAGGGSTEKQLNEIVWSSAQFVLGTVLRF